jgi:hypothetical protein
MRNSAFFQLWPLLRGLLLLAIIGGGSATAIGRPSAQSGGQVSGWVRRADGAGIAGASVEIGGRTLVSDARGNLPPLTVPLDGLSASVDVTVRARGYAEWRYISVELSAAHPVALHVTLGDQPTLIAPQQPGQGAASVLDGPPDYINVGRTFSTSCVYPPTNVQRVDRMPFIDYVRNVLPNEWIASWPAASLDAGAIAVSQYAWSVAFMQRKWTRYNYPFDVLDSTCDQVYKDRASGRNYAPTDAAVGRMWGVALLRNSALFTTFYRAYDDQCGTNLDCMGQYGSRDRANEGLSGLQIVQHYYSRRAPFVVAQTAPAARALVLSRSPNVTIWPGHSETLTVCLRNAGTSGWQQNLTNLGVVDPENPDNTAYSSPLADPSWRSPQRPATLTQPSVALGQNGSWSFTLSAAPTIAPGVYQLAVKPIQSGGATWITTDAPIVWSVTVLPPSTLSARAWLPLTTGQAAALTCP